jgi:hypothetical protein
MENVKYSFFACRNGYNGESAWTKSLNYLRKPQKELRRFSKLAKNPLRDKQVLTSRLCKKMMPLKSNGSRVT